MKVSTLAALNDCGWSVVSFLDCSFDVFCADWGNAHDEADEDEQAASNNSRNHFFVSFEIVLSVS